VDTEKSELLVNNRFALDSNPTLSAILLKINELTEFQDPLSGSLFVFGTSDMQFCKAPVRSVKAETDRLGISFRVAKKEFCRPR
jgi:hypothetical protein